MSELNKPAMPQHYGKAYSEDQGGMTLRQYAAIQLRVPMSGDDELDSMIREARRLDMSVTVAQKALHLAEPLKGPKGFEWLFESEQPHINPVAQPDDEGWIAWNGGECPVQGNWAVGVKLRNGKTNSDKARRFVWHTDGVSNDIIAYRVIDKA